MIKKDTLLYVVAHNHEKYLEQSLDSLVLVKHLVKYAETGTEYTEVLQKIITQNSLKDFDEARLLPSSKDLESLI